MTPTVPRRLPITIIPLTGETLDGFLRRLALRNATSYGALHKLVCDQPDPTAALAGFTGLSRVSLCRALPELAPGLSSAAGQQHPGLWRSPACTYCAAVHAAAISTTVFVPADRSVCRKHRRWIGGPRLPCTASQQFCCTAAPEVLAAATRHHRLACTWGSALTCDAFDDALKVFQYWRTHGILTFTADSGLTTRRQALGWVTDTAVAEPIIAACCYPGMVTLTGILLRLRTRIHRGADARTSVDHAYTEIACTVLRGAEPGGPGDPLRYIATSPLWWRPLNE